MNALGALGLEYGESDDESEGESAPPPPQAAPPAVEPTRPEVAVAPISLPSLAAAVLPDAGSLGLPDQEDWDTRSSGDAEDEVAHDPVGTRYNAVAVPSTISMASEEHNYKVSKGAAPKASHGAALLEALGRTDFSSTSASAPGAAAGGGVSKSAQRGKSSSPSGVLLPPQLRRPNVTTEELSNMRTAKRPKVPSMPSSSS